MSNSQLEESMEKSLHKKIAKILNLSLSDLEETEFEINTIESDDGHPYYHQIKFNPSSPRRILKKIKGLDENDTYDIQLNDLD